jgi:hypothetical protein
LACRCVWHEKFVEADALLEFLFYNPTSATFSDLFPRTTHTVSPHCSRKSFFAKLGGLIAATGLLPKALANSDTNASAPAAPAFQLRPEQRAVARKESL